MPPTAPPSVASRPVAMLHFDPWWKHTGGKHHKSPHWDDPHSSQLTTKGRVELPSEEHIVLEELARGQGLMRGAVKWLKVQDSRNQEDERADMDLPPDLGANPEVLKTVTEMRHPPERGPKWFFSSGAAKDRHPGADVQFPVAHRYPHDICERLPPTPTATPPDLLFYRTD